MQICYIASPQKMYLNIVSKTLQIKEFSVIYNFQIIIKNMNYT